MNTLQKWLLEPSAKIERAEDRRQAKLLSILLLIAILAVMAEQVVGGNIPVWFLVLFFIIYGVSRTPYYHLAAVGSILLLSIPSYLVVLTLEEFTILRAQAAFMWIVVPIIFCSVFLSFRETAVIIALYVASILVLPFLNSAIELSILWGSLGFVLTVGILALVVMRQRDLVEYDRQIELQRSEERLKIALGAGKMGVWSWDLITNRVEWSPQTEVIFGLTPGVFDQTPEMYISLVYPEDQDALRQAIRTGLAQPESEYSVQHRVLLPTQEIRWVEGRGKVTCNKAGEPLMFIGTATDITSRRKYETEKEGLLIALEAKNEALQQEAASREQTELALRQSEESAQEFQKQLIALQEVIIELTQADTFDDLCRLAVELGCSQLWFERLGVWLFDDQDPGIMVGSYGIDEQGNLRDERDQRLPIGPVELFDGNQNSSTQVKSWRRNLLYDDNQNVVGEGWNVIAPLWRRDQVIGYVSADNLLEKRPFSQDLLELLGLYASTLSHLVVRKQQEEKAQRRREMLEKVVELGKQVTQVADLRECLWRIYQIVQESLGFDRVGIFLYDGPTEQLVGTFGTDKDGNLCEEWDMKLPAHEVSPSGHPLHMAEHVIFARDFQTTYGYSVEGTHDAMVGVRQHVRVVSWVGDQPVAVINVDNLVTQRPISEEQVEGLNLFSGYAGLAIENARLLAQVQEAEQRYRSIFENAVEGIFQVADEGYFLSANPALSNMFGYEMPEQFIANISDIGKQIYVNPDRFLELGEELAAKGQVTNFEFEVNRRDGSRAWISQNVQTVYDAQGALLYFEGTAQDITDRKQAGEERESLIRELERRNAELERFTYTVSHDLKSPLITIQGFLGFIERDAIAGNIDRLKADIARISEATKRMQQLLDELLELSRIGRLVNPSEMVPFADLVEEALRLVSGRLMQREVKVVVSLNLPEVFVDRRRLVEVLQNLLDNAAKFMGNQPEPRIDIGVRRVGNETAFFVRDNGVGIVQAYQETVFGLFERVDQTIEGTGIGLALVRRIIEVHNGRLWVESAGREQGSTFYFTLPLVDPDNEMELS